MHIFLSAQNERRQNHALDTLHAVVVRVQRCTCEWNLLCLRRYVGLKNLGNSCYMNSVLQVLWTLPSVQQRYAAQAEAIFQSAPADPTTDVPTQVNAHFCHLGVKHGCSSMLWSTILILTGQANHLLIAQGQRPAFHHRCTGIDKLSKLSCLACTHSFHSVSQIYWLFLPEKKSITSLSMCTG